MFVTDTGNNRVSIFKNTKLKELVDLDFLVF